MSFFRSTKPTNRPQHNFDSERAQNIAAQAMRHIMNEEEDSTSSGATHQPAKPKPVVPDFDDLLPGFEPVDGYTPKPKTFFSPSNGQTDLTGNPSVREPQGEMFADEDDEDEELEKFRQEAAHDRTDNFDPLDAVATLTKAVEDALIWEEIRKYRQQSLKEDEVAVAMNAINLKGSAKTMTFLLAAFIVGGRTALTEYDDIMQEETVTEHDVIAIKEELERVDGFPPLTHDRGIPQNT